MLMRLFGTIPLPEDHAEKTEVAAAMEELQCMQTFGCIVADGTGLGKTKEGLSTCIRRGLPLRSRRRFGDPTQAFSSRRTGSSYCLVGRGNRTLLADVHIGDLPRQRSDPRQAERACDISNSLQEVRHERHSSKGLSARLQDRRCPRQQCCHAHICGHMLSVRHPSKLN
jgi:hypothetical protein